MDQLVAQTADQAQRAKRRQLWLDRVQREIAAAAEWQASRDPERLVARLDQMVEVSNQADVLAPSDKQEIRACAREAKVEAYVRHADHLLEQAMAASHDKQRAQERGELLKRVNQAFNVLVRLGADGGIQQGIKGRLEIVRQTSAAGDSAKAKEAAEREAARVEAAYPHEQRMFTRWREPAIVVTIEGRPFQAVDWSLGGVLVEGVEDRGWKSGQVVDVRIGLPDGTLHGDRMLVARYDADHKRLGIKSRRFASVLMQVKRDCERAGVEPL